MPESISITTHDGKPVVKITTTSENVSILNKDQFVQRMLKRQVTIDLLLDVQGADQKILDQFPGGSDDEHPSKPNP